MRRKVLPVTHGEKEAKGRKKKVESVVAAANLFASDDDDDDIMMTKAKSLEVLVPRGMYIRKLR